MAVYEITSVSRNDQGYYICMAQNTAGVSEERIQLYVEEEDNYPKRGDIPGKFHSLLLNNVCFFCNIFQNGFR